MFLSATISNAPSFPQDPKNHLAVVSLLPSLSLPITTLINTGAIESFIDEAFVKTHRLETSKLKTARLLFLFDGSPSTNGRIHNVVDLDLDVQGLGKVAVRLLVTPLPNKFPIVLGFDFLKKHNPIMDWGGGSLRPRFETSGTAPTRHPPPTPPPTPASLPNPSAEPAQVTFAGRALVWKTEPVVTELQLRGTSSIVFDNDEADDTIADIMRVVPEEYQGFTDVFSKA